MTVEIGERPWGTYEVLTESDGYKVKRITVVPGGRLSLQSHQHRAEHWVVVTGIATVTVGENVRKVAMNEHVIAKKPISDVLLSIKKLHYKVAKY